MPRFFVDAPITDSEVTIVGEDALHIARALRMATGEEVTVCDPDGRAYLCRLTRIRDDAVTAEVVSASDGRGEPPYRLLLCMGYPKGDKLDYVVRKAVEMGATEILPFVSSRCVRRPHAERADKQTERLLRIAHEAAKQCGRLKLPTVCPPVSYAEMLSRAVTCDLPLFCYEGEGTRPLREVLTGHAGVRSVSVVVGSEGGFSQEEAETARTAGCCMVGLGPRILRCETAPLYALAALSYQFE